MIRLPGFFVTMQIPRVQPQSDSVTSVAGSGHLFFENLSGDSSTVFSAAGFGDLQKPC